FPACVHGFTDATVMFAPGAPAAGDAVNVRRFGGRRLVVVVVLEGFEDVLVTTRVVGDDACVLLVLVDVDWACAAQLHVRAMMTPNTAPSTSWARRVTLIYHLRRSAETLHSHAAGSRPFQPDAT